MSNKSKHHHFVICKPYGFLSQFITNQNVKKKHHKLLGELADFPEGIMAIGRLDRDSEGLLLLTTDGKKSYHILSNKVDKEYYVQVDGIITESAIKQLKNGVEITVENSEYTTKPCPVKMLNSLDLQLPIRAKKIRDDRHGPTSWISITLREGKFRQVRKMTAAVGFPTLRLVRYRIGTIELGQMQAGDVIELDDNFTV
ncbi:MAG: pseudouridine synthase [Flavobacteriaceae bacterium]